MKYILGGGISGLIYHHYHPEYKIISDGPLGGQFTSKFSLGPRVLHDSPDTRELLDDLGIIYEPKTMKQGYCIDGEVKGHLSPKQAAYLASKKMTDARYPIVIQRTLDKTIGQGKIKDGVIEYLDTSIPKLIESLTIDAEPHIISDKIYLISNNRNVLTGQKGRYHYSHLLSTIPAPVFSFLCFDNPPYDPRSYLPATYVLADQPPMSTEDAWEEYGWIYMADGTHAATRVHMTDDGFIYEFTGDFSRPEIQGYLLDAKVKDTFISKMGQVFTKPVEDTEYITFLGRFAQWDHRVLIHSTIEKALKEGIK